VSKVIKILTGGAGVVDTENKRHRIKIGGEAIDETPDTPKNRETYLGIPIKEEKVKNKEKTNKVLI